MPGQDTSSFDTVLKTVYGPGLVVLLPTKTKVLDIFQEMDAKEWGGRFVEYPAMVGRNQGAGWASELGALPAAQRLRHTPVRIPMRYMYGRIGVSAQVMKASEGAKNSFANAMELEMRQLLKTMQSQRGRTIMHDGRGVMSLINDTSPTGSTTLDIDAPGGVAGATNGGRFINPGDVIAAIAPGTGALRSAGSVRTVQSVATDGTSLVLDAAMSGAAIADNDFIVKAANTAVTDASDTSYQKEAMGLLGLVDDGTNLATLHNVNRTTYPIYQSGRINVNGGLSADVIQRIIDLADERGDGEISDLIMYQSVRRAYLSMTEGDRRYTAGDLSRPDAGTVAAKRGRLTFGGIPITEEKYCPYGTIFAVDRMGMKRFVETPGEWAEESGAVLKQIGTGNSLQDAFEAYYRLWENYHNDYPATCGRLDNVTATIVVAHID